MKKLVVVSVLFLYACNNKHTLFVKLPASHTGISFNNRIIENDSLNPLDLEFLYNGGGVAIGDFDNNGLPDVYFTASTTPNKLYLNKGNHQCSCLHRQIHLNKTLHCMRTIKRFSFI